MAWLSKRADVGIGTLIIFIASVLVAVIGAAVIITTQGKLQEESLRVGNTAREAIGTNVFLQRVRGTDGSDGKIEFLEMMVKLSDGATPMKLNRTTIAVHSGNSSTSMTYAGTGDNMYFANKPNRTIDWAITASDTRLMTDLDGDLKEDYIRIKDNTTLEFNLTKDGALEITIPSIALPNSTVDIDADIVTEDSGERGSISIHGTTETAGILDSNVSIYLYPKDADIGGFSVTFPLTGNRHVRDALVFGDVMKVYVELTAPIGEGEEVSIDFLTPVGTPMEKRIKTPDVMTDHTISLFP